MSKRRVHEIAKEAGVSSKELLAALKAAGIEAKAAASNVEEADAKKLFKMKEIYQLLESVTDRCQDVANIVEAIVLENA